MSNFRVFNSETLLSRLSETGLHEEANLSSFQQSLNQSVAGFTHQLTDLQTIAPMMAGSVAYRLFRSGSLALMGSNLPSRMFSTVIGLAGEVTVFEEGNRLMLPSPQPSPLAGEGRGEGGFWTRWRHSFVNFGLLKFGGHLGAGQNLFVQHLMQDSAMVVGNYATAALNLGAQPEGNLFEQF
ncbi:MAG: hypothetical protein JNK65_08615, partial [Deltaproteobacteria bacterium]|nr:hypothetical protein [Deltaproteobacteria bacterium]